MYITCKVPILTYWDIQSSTTIASKLSGR